MKRLSTLLLVLVFGTGCSSLTESIGDSFSSAMLNQDDPEIMRDAIPAYLMMVDALIDGSPDSTGMLLAGAKLYGAYGSSFVNEEKRKQRMSSRALGYAKRAFCEELEDSCLVLDKPLDDFMLVVNDEADEDEVPVMYGLAAAWAGWIQAHSSDWVAVGQIPKVKALMQKVLSYDETWDGGNAHLYLGVLAAQVPPSLGGKPDVAKAHFEKAIDISKGKNLMAKVFYAQFYARLMFDQELHDNLLKEVLAAETTAPNLTLINTLAKRQAEQLLAGSADFF